MCVFKLVYEISLRRSLPKSYFLVVLFFVVIWISEKFSFLLEKNIFHFPENFLVENFRDFKFCLFCCLFHAFDKNLVFFVPSHGWELCSSDCKVRPRLHPYPGSWCGSDRESSQREPRAPRWSLLEGIWPGDSLMDVRWTTWSSVFLNASFKNRICAKLDEK